MRTRILVFFYCSAWQVAINIMNKSKQNGFLEVVFLKELEFDVLILSSIQEGVILLIP